MADDLEDQLADVLAESREHEREAKRHRRAAAAYDVHTGADLALEHHRENATELLIDELLDAAPEDLPLEQRIAVLDQAHAVDPDTLLREGRRGGGRTSLAAVREHADRIRADLFPAPVEDQPERESARPAHRDRGQGRRPRGRRLTGTATGAELFAERRLDGQD